MRNVEFFRFARFNSQGLQGSILKVCKVQFLRFARFSSEIRVPFLHSYVERYGLNVDTENLHIQHHRSMLLAVHSI